MQILAAVICFFVIYTAYKLLKWLDAFMMRRYQKEMLDYKHRKNGKEKTHKRKT